MANSILKTDDGKIAFEDFVGQTDGDDITAPDFTIINEVGKTFKVDTQGGLKCVTASEYNFQFDNNTNFLIAEYENTNREIFHQHLIWNAVVSAQTGATYRRVGESGGVVFWRTLANYNLNWVAPNRLTPVVGREPTATNEKWLIRQCFHRDAITGRDAENESYVYNTSDERIVFHDTNSLDWTAYPIGTGNEEYCFAQDWRNNVFVRFTKLLWSKSKYLFLAGLTAGMRIDVLDTSDNLLRSIIATGTTAELDMIGLDGTTGFPTNFKLRAIGTDGSTLHTTASVEICPGDTWTYSGDYTGASGGGVISIMGGNIL